MGLVTSAGKLCATGSRLIKRTLSISTDVGNPLVEQRGLWDSQ